MPMNGLVPDEGQKFQAAMQGLMAMFQQMSKQGAPASTPRPSGMSAMGAFGPANASALDKYRQQMIQDTQFSEMQRKQEEAKAQAEARTRFVGQLPQAGQGPMSGALAADVVGAGGDPLATYKAMQGGKKTPFEMQRDMLMARGMPRKQAEDLAGKYIRNVTDPVSGAHGVVNLADQTYNSLANQPTLPKKTQADIIDQNRAIDRVVPLLDDLEGVLSDAVGVVPAAKELWGKTAGQLPTGEVDVPGVGKIGVGEKAVSSAVISARTKARLVKEELIRAFRKQGRVPVSEQQRLIALLDTSAWTSAPVAKRNLQTIRNFLQTLKEESRAKGPIKNIKSNPDINRLKSKYGLE